MGALNFGNHQHYLFAMTRLLPLRVLAAVVVLSFSMVLGVSAQPYTFADLAWGSSRAVVRRTLESRGYTYRAPSSRDLEATFHGRLMDEDVLVFVNYGVSDNLLKIVVSLRTSNRGGGERTRAVFEQMSEVLTGRYGAPEEVFQFCEYPYESNKDCLGNWSTAVAVKKVHWSQFWPNRERSALYIDITNNDDVGVRYEAPGWSEELNRRREAETSDF